MGEWKEYRLGDIAQILDYKRVPLSAMERVKRKGNYPYYGASGIIDYVDDYIFDGEYLVISEDGENLRTRKTPIAFIANGKFWVNNHAHIIKANPTDTRLLLYLFANLDLNEFITGAVQPKLNQASLNSIPIYLPQTQEEREKIAEILSSIDAKIDLLNNQNATLESMAETLFRHHFIDNAQADWVDGVISDIADHYKVSVSPKKLLDTLFYHYSIPSFDNGKNPVVEMGAEIQSGKYSVPHNCLLFSKLNPHKDKRIWLMLDNVEDDAICSTEFQVVKPKNNYYLYFIYGWLSYNDNYNDIASGVGGTSGSHQRIDPATIFSFGCPLVDEDAIVKYNKQVDGIFKKQISNQEQVRTLTKLRDTLLPKLMAETLFRHHFIGNTQADWVDGFLGDYIIETVGGEWGKENTQGEFTKVVQCIRGTDVADLNVGISTKAPIRYVKDKKFQSIEPQEGDIIIEISGGTENQSTGRCTYINVDVKQLFSLPLVFSNFCRLLRIKKKEFSFFLYEYISYLYNQDEFFNLENGSSGIKNLDYKSLLYGLKFKLPTDENQIINYHSEVETYFKKINTNKMQILTLTKLRDTLLPRLMSNEIKI